MHFVHTLFCLQSNQQCTIYRTPNHAGPMLRHSRCLKPTDVLRSEHSRGRSPTVATVSAESHESVSQTV